ncbi:MAG: phosphonoacetate hydrolase [Alphaproteobacteria bacterium]|jgi:phosphonoacetate hydrolase|nr:phosphonoacetate hydrolase [Rhodospirillaceae bacterium]MDP6022879.1 phosphonoacetate hydrolase [Alphaproteobacteria bacterium]MDP6255966.1 phosphonoacetate hydrolase [Alphaproteobacteria bacterium]MDP7055846.1 phosphonoacetate hydrolase [Alphaproteobacteria bacterium]MDP7230543.1 phosphonoacetate hydrolase [Alphaproteobacteria bacterium]|tara:strand:- start:30835 stop:32070 length:1236 start_codon:yes stop_codon:yes gene_type:complete
MSQDPIWVNGRSYAWPDRPVVVLCIDGSQPGYIEAAVEAGVAPFFAKILQTGTNRLADCVVPSFTNPNNLSIVTGAPPAVHGICGNYFLDPETGGEVMMNEPRFLRAPTLFQVFQAAGAAIVTITAKDKLRGLLGHGLEMGEKGICFSSELADQANLVEHGIGGVLDMVGLEVPDVYSAELSGFVLAAGVKIMAARRPELMYLSTTDYIQHKHAPGTPVANDFYALLDGYLGQLDAMGCTIVATADHGMNAKHDETGLPRVIYLQSLLDDWLGEAAARVILPITDPYVVHHGALGSYATAYLPDGADGAGIAERLRAIPGMELVLDNAGAAERFELPPDRLGDLVLVSAPDHVLGAAAERHDLSGLEEPLRSHGGISEQRVPLLMNRPTDLAEGHTLRNFDAFDLALNHAV